MAEQEDILTDPPGSIMTLFDEVRERIRKTGMLSGYGRVIAAVSGGADSVFLFYALKGFCEAQKKNGETCPVLEVLHIHHGIRGEEADRDATFTENLCRKHGVPFHLVKRNIPEEAGERGMTLEEAGRAARYEEFARMGEIGRTAIALAHHRDDQAETLLFRLARGTGLMGLSGMREVRGFYIRPLLGVSREAIEQCLRENKMTWMEDSTNRENDAARNRIRHHVLPVLCAEVNPRAAEHIAQTAEMLAEAGDFFLFEAERRADRYLAEELPDRTLIRRELLSEMPVMQSEVLRIAVSRIPRAMQGRDFGRVHIEALRELLAKEVGKHLDLPGGLIAERVSDGVLLGSSQNASVPKMADNGCIFLREVEAVPLPVPENRYTKWFDYDKMNHVPQVRTRKEGDYLTVNAGGGRKSLSDYFTDQKVPKAMRDRILLLADGSEIMWVTGMRIGYRYRITGTTKRFLQADWDPGCEGGPDLPA
ncbi:MAG: tRNA lysidine(34) synthetase TilS [Lachnospiraceae bacterium]|nr:tRNA lysidine(34) synthetase TilS [Lachnospiraceae bacterium]